MFAAPGECIGDPAPDHSRNVRESPIARPVRRFLPEKVQRKREERPSSPGIGIGPKNGQRRRGMPGDTFQATPHEEPGPCPSKNVRRPLDHHGHNRRRQRPRHPKRPKYRRHLLVAVHHRNLSIHQWADRIHQRTLRNMETRGGNERRPGPSPAEIGDRGRRVAGAKRLAAAGIWKTEPQRGAPALRRKSSSCN